MTGALSFHVGIPNFHKCLGGMFHKGTKNSVLGKWGFGFCNWGLTFGLGLGDGLCNSTTRGTFSCPIFEQNILLEIS